VADVSKSYSSKKFETEELEKLYGDVGASETQSVSSIQDQDSVMFISNVPISGPIRYTDRVYSLNGLAWSPERGLLVITDKQGYDFY
jgi:hypothetical protein